MKTWMWIRIILLAVSSTLMLLNSMTAKSPLIGIPTSIAVLYISFVATGDIFFPQEKRFLRQALGLAMFVIIMALLGVFLILIARFTETLSIISFTAVGLILCFFSVLRQREDILVVSEQLRSGQSVQKKFYLLVSLFLLSVTIAFYALLLARTGEGVISVWLRIPNFFLPVFFLSSLSLTIILFFTEINVGLKLTLVSLYSFLAHSLFLLVWYPGRYGDLWSYLGNARYVDWNSKFYAYEWLFSQRLVADIVRYQAQVALDVFFRRIFSLDIHWVFSLYWVHVFLIPLLWSIFVPITSYKMAELLAVKKTKTFPLLCAMGAGLFPNLIYWGAFSQAYSLGFIFLFFSIMLILYWVDTRSKPILFLAVLASATSFFTHPTPGIFAFSFLLVAVVFWSRLHSILKIAFLTVISAIYPFTSYLQKATFSLEGLLNPENLLSFQVNVFTILLVFGFLGLVFSIRGKLVKGKSALMLFTFYIIVAASYYVSMYGMKNAIVPQRIPSMADLLLLPFVALGLMVTANFLKDGFSRVKTELLKNAARPRSVSTLIICLLLSLLAASALYQAYPRQEITEVQPAAYELEAVLYLDSTAESRYVVLGDTNLATLAEGFLGIDYSYGAPSAKGNFGLPEWYVWNMGLYQQMVRSPSLSVLEEAMLKAGVVIVYFVVSVREPYYEDIVQRTSEVLQPYRTFGEGKLTVFKYTSPTIPITGNGPVIKVAFDGGSFMEAQTQYEYFSKSAVKYIAKLSGYSSYNITDYPTYWTFYDLTLNYTSTPFDESSDVNTFIYKTGLKPSDALEVVWQANDHYPHAGWKEDSFKYNWQTHPTYAVSNLSSTVRTHSDGNVLRISANFSLQGEYLWYYQSKKVNNISTDAFPYILVKWRSTGPVAGVIVAYPDREEKVVVPTGSESSDWTVTIEKLDPGKEIAFVIVGISNLPDFKVEGLQTLYVDYVLLCAPE